MPVTDTSACLHRERTPPRRCVSCAAWLSSGNQTDTCWHHDRTWTESEEDDRQNPMTQAMYEAIGEAFDRALDMEALVAA